MSDFVENLFPFHFILNEQMEIVRTGRSAKKLFPCLKGSDPFYEHFDITRPKIERSFLNIRKYEDSMFLIQAKNNAQIQLKGKMNYKDEDNTLLFVFTPIVRDVSFFKEFNMTMDDLPFYDNTLEFLFALQAANKGLDEARQLNKKFEEKVDQRTYELQQKNEEIQAQNEIFVQQQEQLNKQSVFLEEKNRKLQKARELIHSKNRELKQHSINLEKEVRARTEDLTVMNKELLEQNKQLEQFAFIVAHNLRAPIARILGLINLMKLQSIITNESEFYIESILVATERLEEVIKDLNIILEIRKGLNELYEEVCLDGKLAKVKETLKNQIDDARAIIEEDFSGGRLVLGVSSYVENILYNLVSNAIKYKHSERVPEIKVSTRKVGNEICLSVDDNGIGFDIESNKDNMFKLYRRFHDHVDGKGLGLYMIKTQSEALGGKIEVSSDLDVGSSFKVYFKCP
jgi:signal transduction histidine kinase